MEVTCPPRAKEGTDPKFGQSNSLFLDFECGLSSTEGKPVGGGPRACAFPLACLSPAGKADSASAFPPLLSCHLCTSALAYFALDLLGLLRLTPRTPVNLNCFLSVQLPPQKGHLLWATLALVPSILFRPSPASALSQSVLLLCSVSSRYHLWKGPSSQGRS